MVHPPKQTWNLKMNPWKRRFLLETIISRFHVEFGGVHRKTCQCLIGMFTSECRLLFITATSGKIGPKSMIIVSFQMTMGHVPRPSDPQAPSFLGVETYFSGLKIYAFSWVKGSHYI